MLWLVVEATNSLDQLKQVEQLMEEKAITAYPVDGKAPASPAPGWTLKPALLVVTRLDEPGGPEDVEILKELLDEPWPMVPVSATAGTGLDDLRVRTFQALDIVRVYTKQPGKPPDKEQPFTFRRGATVADLARAIHKEVQESLKFARIWGAEVYDGQTVQREHVLADGDVIEIHS
jgi:ribosome-interacting GTPase 1